MLCKDNDLWDDWPKQCAMLFKALHYMTNQISNDLQITTLDQLSALHHFCVSAENSVGYIDSSLIQTVIFIWRTINFCSFDKYRELWAHMPSRKYYLNILWAFTDSSNGSLSSFLCDSHLLLNFRDICLNWLVKIKQLHQI